MERFTVISTDLNEVTKKIYEVEEECWDCVCPNLSKAQINLDEKTSGIALGFYDENGFFRESMLTPFSLGQLCDRIGIPVQYVDKCIRKGAEWASELLIKNMNTWLSHANDQTVLIRGYGDSIRGILSHQYTVFDAPAVISGVENGFGSSISDYSVEGYCVSPERLHIRIVKNTPINGLREDLYVGLMIDSSDVGNGSINIGYFIFKKVCTNGLIVKRLRGIQFRQIHRGSVKNVGENVLRAIQGLDDYETSMIPMIQKASAIDYSHALLDEDSFAYNALLSRVKTQTGLSNKMTKDVFRIAVTRYEPTAWGVINAITEAAQRYSLDKRLQIEEAAGFMMQMVTS